MLIRLIGKCFIWVLLCVFQLSYAQSEIKSVLLKDLIPALETQFSVQFTYLESYINESVLSVNVKEEPLTLILQNLEKQTQLRFELTDKQHVLIRPFKETDKLSICGFIMYNANPLSNVEVQSVLSLQTVLTDEKGYFELKDVPYKSNLVLRYEGGFLKSLPAVSSLQLDCLKIHVNLYEEKLEEVTIAQYLTKGVTKKAQSVIFMPNDFTVLAGLTEPDILQGLQHIPGVQSPFETASKIYVRGGTPDQNLVLWNGIKTYNQSHFFGLISAFNPNLVDEVTFYNKGINARYGDRVAGVIDINSSKKVASKFTGGVGANLIHADAYASVPIIKDKLSVSASGRRSFTDLWQSVTYDQLAARVFQNTKIENTSAVANTNTFYFLDYTFGVQAEISKKDQLQFNTLFAQNDLNFKSQLDSESQTDELVTENDGYSLQWQHTYTPFLEQQTKIYNANYLLDYTFKSTSASTENRDQKRNFIKDFGALTYFNLKLGKKSTIQLGYEWSDNTIRYDFVTATPNLSIVLDEDRTNLVTHSLFSEYELKKKNDYLIQLGVRANSYSISDAPVIEPRVYIQKNIFKNINLNTSFTRQSQAITQIQESVVSSLTLENLVWRVADEDDFKIIKTMQFSLGGTYKNNSWFVELDGYLKQDKNITTLTSGFLNPIGDDFSTGESRVVGGELFIKKKFRSYSSWISYNYNNNQTKFESINNNKFFASNTNIEHTFRWLHFYKLKQFQFSLSWLFHTGKSVTDITTTKVEGKPVSLSFGALNTGNLPVYHKLDFSALYNFKLSSEKIRYELGVSIQNLYNRKSVINREFRRTPGIDNNLLRTDFESLGFTPNISFRLFWE